MLTPDDTLSDCISAIPAFGPYWADEDVFRSEDGSFTACGVYLTLAWFLREHWQSLNDSEWRAIASLALDHNARADNPSATVGASLIEGLAGEEFSPLVVRYFDKRLLSRYGFGD